MDANNSPSPKTENHFTNLSNFPYEVLLKRDITQSQKIIDDMQVQLEFQELLTDSKIRRELLGALVDSTGNIEIAIGGRCYIVFLESTKLSDFPLLIRDIFSVIEVFHPYFPNPNESPFMRSYAPEYGRYSTTFPFQWVDVIATLDKTPASHLYALLKSIANHDNLITTMKNAIKYYKKQNASDEESNQKTEFYLKTPLTIDHLNFWFNTYFHTSTVMPQPVFSKSHDRFRIVLRNRHQEIKGMIHVEFLNGVLLELPIQPLVVKNRNSYHEFIAPGNSSPCFLNEESFSIHKNIIIFSDLLTAYKMYEVTFEYILSNFVGSIENIDAYDWSIFENKNVEYYIFNFNNNTLPIEIKKSIEIGRNINQQCSINFSLVNIADRSISLIGNFEELQKYAIDAGIISSADDEILLEMKECEFDPNNAAKSIDLIEGIALVGSISLLAGPSNSGKSLLAQELAGQLSEETGLFLGARVKKSNVVIFDTEIPDNVLQQRFHLFSLEKVKWFSLRKYTDNPKIDGLTEFICAKMNSFLRNLKCDVIIVDSIFKVVTNLSTSDKDIRTLLSWANDHINKGKSVIFVSHYKRSYNPKDDLQEKIGGGARLIRGTHNRIVVERSTTHDRSSDIFNIEFDLKCHKKDPVFTHHERTPPRHRLIENITEFNSGSKKENSFNEEENTQQIEITPEEAKKFIIKKVPTSKGKQLSKDDITLKIMLYFKCSYSHATKQPNEWVKNGFLKETKEGALKYYCRLPEEFEKNIPPEEPENLDTQE
ncbi:MAG: hypothetical protein RL095_321 [Verrucomicrobiota bacterium]|jgi:archaellum biogenesis ATPase FlaH